MQKHVRNTKQQILDTALKLFSQKGYTAVSIRDICYVVGIKESTIYYHFENKRAIFQELLKIFEEITNSKPERFNKELVKITKVEKDAFIAVGIGILTDYFLKDNILQFIRMLMIEQQIDEEASDLYRHLLFEEPMKHHSEVFTMLIKMGMFRNYVADYMSLEYYSPILFIFQRYFGSGEVTPEKLNKATKELRAHLETFYERYSLSNS
jgi:AcrR family transcriptional regulator